MHPSRQRTLKREKRENSYEAELQKRASHAARGSGAVSAFSEAESPAAPLACNAL